MTFRWWDRWGPLAGALGVICFIVAIVMYGTGPGDNDTEIVDYFSKGSNQTKYIVAFYFFLVAFATSVIALRTGVFPRWFAWIGLPVAVTFLLAFFFVPIFVLWGWILVASGLMLLSVRRGPRPITRAP